MCLMFPKIVLGIALVLSVHLPAYSNSTTKAKKGEGIYQLLKRNGLSEEKLEAFIKLNQDKIGPKNSLYLDRTYKLPEKDKPTTITEPLWGKDFETIDLVGNELEDAVFYLVSGHGGPDPGAVAKVSGHTITEDEYAYDVTLRLGRRLASHGAKVHFIIRDESVGIRNDRYLSNNKSEVCTPNQRIPSDQRKRLKQRSDAVNKIYRTDTSPYKRCIVIHVDARSKNQKIDVFFYHHKKSSASKRLATEMRDMMKRNYKASQPNRSYEGSVSSRSLYVINKIIPPVVFIELGNIHHPRDQKRILEPNNREAMANWLCQGIIEDRKRSR